MSQGEIQEIVEKYIASRQWGLDAKKALQHLRPRIEQLSAADKGELVRLVRAWEGRGTSPSAPPVKPLSSIPRKTRTEDSVADVLKRAETQAREEPPHASLRWEPALPVATEIECPHCKRKNPAHEFFCAYCGYFIQESWSAGGTSRVEPIPEITSRPDYFGEQTTLVLFVRHNHNQFSVNPQRYQHDIILGRSGDSALKPDIDFTDDDAVSLGVSRIHLSLHYEPEDSTLSAQDMGSANGSFVNGQRLHPREVRLLRHNDELRLGHLVLSVQFQQPTE